MNDPVQAWRRWFGLLFLILAGGMLLWGETILKPHLGRGLLFLGYWLACMLFTALAMLMALLDFRSVRRRIREEQVRIIDEATRRNGSEDDDEPRRSDPQ